MCYCVSSYILLLVLDKNGGGRVKFTGQDCAENMGNDKQCHGGMTGLNTFQLDYKRTFVSSVFCPLPKQNKALNFVMSSWFDFFYA